MSGFPDGYSAPGTLSKASATMMHARGVKKFKKPVASFRGGDPIEWNTQTDVSNANVGVGIEPGGTGGDNDTSRFLEYHSQFYDDVSSGDLDSVCDDGECDEGRMHLACCAAHLAQAKESHNACDSEATEKALNGAVYHLQAFHQSLKDALN